MRKELVERVLHSVIPRSRHLEGLMSQHRLSAPLKPGMENRVHSGTTILAFRYSEGIMFAADRKTSSGGLGIISQETIKLYKLSDRSAMGCAGWLGDIQFVVKILEEVNGGFSSQFGYPLSTLGQVSYLSNLLRNFRFYVLPWGLEVEAILGGYDLRGEFEIYEIWSDGGRRKSEYLATGSGTDGALSVLRSSKNLINKRALTLEDSIDLAVRAIFRAGEVDSGTSDIRVAIPTIATITKEGFQTVDSGLIEKAVQSLLDKEERNV